MGRFADFLALCYGVSVELGSATIGVASPVPSSWVSYFAVAVIYRRSPEKRKKKGVSKMCSVRIWYSRISDCLLHHRSPVVGVHGPQCHQQPRYSQQQKIKIKDIEQV